MKKRRCKKKCCDKKNATESDHAVSLNEWIEAIEASTELYACGANGSSLLTCKSVIALGLPRSRWKERGASADGAPRPCGR
jgi:hypothetical protein